jgi:transporter family-2 protein
VATWVLWLCGLCVGVLIPIQTALNARLGRTTGHPLVSSIIVFVIGGLICVAALLITRPPWPAPAAWRELPIWAYGGGVISIVYVVLTVWLAPRLGVGLTTGLILVGQLFAAILLDHFGWFGNPQHTLNPMRALGLSLMVIGLVLIKRF